MINVAENLIAFIEYLGGTAVILAVSRWLYLRDAVATARSSEIVCKPRSALERFGKHLRNSSRRSNQEVSKLLELETLLKELRLNKKRLLFKPNSLNKSSRESLKLFSRLNIPGPANQSYMIGAELLLEWGIPVVPPYEAKKLIEIQKILENPSFFRWALGSLSWIRPLFNKFPYRIRIEKLKQDSLSDI